MSTLARSVAAAVHFFASASLLVGGILLLCSTIGKPPGHVGVIKCAAELAGVLAIGAACALGAVALALHRGRRWAWWLSMALWAILLLWSVAAFLNGVPEMRAIVLATGLVALGMELLLAIAH